MIPEDHDMALYTLYRPAEIPDGVALPALSWANGTCAHPVGYAEMFRHIVSHGFIIVAAHSRYTGSGAAQVNGLDYLVAENDNPDSPLTQTQIEPLHKRSVDQPTPSGQDLIDRRLGSDHHLALHLHDAPPSHGLDHLGVEQFGPRHPARLGSGASGLAPRRLHPVPETGDDGR
jgi:hypothetical protein